MLTWRAHEHSGQVALDTFLKKDLVLCEASETQQVQRMLRSEKNHSSLPERCAIHGCMVRLLEFRGTAMLCFGTHIILNTITSR